ncbi:MAG: M3 family metallopeptidase [Bacteroidaceae bacterium]|nr:M3 family metallopeptidase [Bacteroidaceae bacterium]
MCDKSTNPFLIPFGTLHDTIPFDRIQLSDYEPTILEGIRRHNAEIDAIISNPEPAGFENTIEALDRSGMLLTLVVTVLENLNQANTSDEMQELVLKLTPLLTEHNNNITLNSALYARIKEAAGNIQRQELTVEQNRLLDNTLRAFVRSGADLNDNEKEAYRNITNQLAQAAILFDQNHLKATNAFRINIKDEKQLSGIPVSAMEMAAEEASSHGEEGWTFTLHAPLYTPMMKYCDSRELRKEMFMAYNTQALSGENSNVEIVRSIVNLRIKLAQLLGYDTFANYVLEERMAEDKATVDAMYKQLLEAYLPIARKDVEAVTEQARSEEGEDFALMPWDFAYYAEHLRKVKYNFDEEKLRPYLQLEHVIEGVFGLATKLYGISFKENPQIQVYHPDVKAYEVFDVDGSFLAVLYADFFPRKEKSSGAWMTSYKRQWIEPDGTDSRPHVSITTNFTKPTANKPALLTYGELETFLHEFGHALHGIFSATHYPSLCSPEVVWDFVEMPSQIMENFGREKAFLRSFAFHYQTGEPLPDTLIDGLLQARNFNAGYACIRQVSFGLLDFAWHSRQTPFDGDVVAYEKEAFRPTQLLPPLPDTCMTVQFSHIMSGGYAASYYSYKWSEMLDADAFSVFAADGVISAKVANRFRKEILERGDAEHPKVLYHNFRGQEPTIDALLRRDGIVKS